MHYKVRSKMYYGPCLYWELLYSTFKYAQIILHQEKNNLFFKTRAFSLVVNLMPVFFFTLKCVLKRNKSASFFLKKSFWFNPTLIHIVTFFRFAKPKVKWWCGSTRCLANLTRAVACVEVIRGNIYNTWNNK